MLLGEDILKNLDTVQESSGIEKVAALQGWEFSIKMETVPQDLSLPPRLLVERADYNPQIRLIVGRAFFKPATKIPPKSHQFWADRRRVPGSEPQPSPKFIRSSFLPLSPVPAQTVQSRTRAASVNRAWELGGG